MYLSDVLRGRRLITQPVEDRESLAGYQLAAPVNKTTVVETVNEETDISIRKVVSSPGQNGASASAFMDSAAASNTSSSLDDENVVDMQQTRQLQNCVNVREGGMLDLHIDMRQGGGSSCNIVDDLADLQVLEELEELPSAEKKLGPISYGDDGDVVQLLKEIPTQRGVICQRQQVLFCEDGMYEEGKQYRIIPGSQSKGAFGEAAMCEDLKTKKTFVRKTVKGKLFRNEIEVPLRFRDNKGIPEVYGVIIKDQDTEIFQEFAGLSLKKLRDEQTDYTRQLCDPKMVMVLAFQAFATLHKMHSQGVTHQDIKPENLCLNIQPNGVWFLKFIDFGSSQTAKDQILEGLTNEYLSPESCKVILQIATGKLPKHAGRLGPGLDVWGLALSLLYCLCGYHAMVYACTGQPKYLEQDPQKLQVLRLQCLLKITAFKDEDILMTLIRRDWPDALQTLLVNTLRVDPNMRWSAKEAAEFIYHNWILKGSGAGTTPQPVPVVAPVVARAVAAATPPSVALPAAAAGIMFRGLNPSRLVFQTQTLQDSERTIEMQAVQCSSPTGASFPLSTSVSPPSPSSSVMDLPSPSQLPDFTDLLSNGTTTKKLPRRARGKQRMEPYHHPPARRGSKNM